MALSEEISALVRSPREALAVEVKDWLDLNDPRHKAKVIKALIALRNRNGGYLLVGFDKAMQPSKNSPANDQTIEFSADAIQQLISKYISEPFEVAIEFPERDGVLYPVLVVPSGVRSPAAAKADLFDGTRTLISTDDVYVRSLNASNVVSSTKPRWKDWPEIVQICFDNREADIGNFLRRHLGAGALDKLHQVSANMAPRHRQSVHDFLHESTWRFDDASKAKESIPAHGYWEVAMIINGDFPPQRLNMDFLRKLEANNPRYTGWPIWLISERFKDESTRPRIFEDRLYEEFVVNVSGGWGAAHIDFMRFDPHGKFYLRRAYEDDLTPKVAPFTTLEFALQILRVAETIAVGMAFARGLGCDPEDTLLSYLFTWHKLSGRELSSWASPTRFFSGRQPADREKAASYIEVPLNMPPSRLGSVVKEVIAPLFDVFDAQVSQDAVDDLSTRLLERRL